jgi:cellulose synthase (UDP-forming)
MVYRINIQNKKQYIFYIVFAVLSFTLMLYYLSDTVIHFTTDRQFPINSFSKYPLTIFIFPAEVFSFLFGMYFVYVLLVDKYRIKKPENLKDKKNIAVAVLLPVYNEPREIIERTLKACKKLIWDGEVKIYLLDDSTKPNYKKIVDELAHKYGSSVVRRGNRDGYKAGNINNAIKNSIREDYFVIFDADQAPMDNFLIDTMDNFSDVEVGFVQTPQHFINNNSILERAVKIGTDIFYRAQSATKAKDNAIPFCGTNLVVRAKAFKAVNGFSYYTATEDIDLGIRMNQMGYKGAYVPKILAHGVSPSDFKSYSSQQYRWSNGNLAILREYWYKILGGNFPLLYKTHMFFTVGWWLIGLVSLIYIVVPILSILFGIGTHHTWLPTEVFYFLFVYVLFGISLIYVSLKGRVEGDDVRFSDALIQYSLIVNSFLIYSRAAINSLLFKRYIGFVTTDKTSSLGAPEANKKEKSLKKGMWKNSGLSQIKWNLFLGMICFGFAVYTLYFAMISVDLVQFRTYFPISLWLLFYSIILFSSILFVGNRRNE